MKEKIKHMNIKATPHQNRLHMCPLELQTNSYLSQIETFCIVLCYLCSHVGPLLEAFLITQNLVRTFPIQPRWLFYCKTLAPDKEGRWAELFVKMSPDVLEWREQNHEILSLYHLHSAFLVTWHLWWELNSILPAYCSQWWSIPSTLGASHHYDHKEHCLKKGLKTE